MTIKHRRSAPLYNPQDYNKDPDPPALYPLDEGPVGGEDDPDDPYNDEDHEHYWCYGRLAGGARLWFGKYKGQCIRDVGWAYLRWCRTNLTRSKLFLKAYDIYAEGARKYAKEHYRDFKVPFGRVYRGMTMRQCRDKPWMLYLKSKAMRQPQWREKHELFFIALDEWLANPRKEQVRRDIGELLRPEEYDDDLGSLYDEQYEEEDLNEADADPDGNLKDFVVSDEAIEYDIPEEDELDAADKKIEAQARAKKKARLSESPKKSRGAPAHVVDEEESSEDGESASPGSVEDVSGSSNNANSASDSDDAYPSSESEAPKTPVKPRKSHRAKPPYIVDDEPDDGEADFVPESDGEESDTKPATRRLTRSMGRPTHQDLDFLTTPSRKPKDTFSRSTRRVLRRMVPLSSDSEVDTQDTSFKAFYPVASKRKARNKESDEEASLPQIETVPRRSTKRSRKA